jgi:cell wall-associated NlpC family hydrolase
MRQATRRDVIVLARSYLGTRWRHQGRTRAFGVDCVGLLIVVSKQLGISTFDTTNYTAIPDGVMLKQRCDELLTPIIDRFPLPGDVLLMWIDGKTPQHLGIVGGEPGALTLIHAYAVERKVVEHPLTEEWLERVCAVYAFPGVE